MNLIIPSQKVDFKKGFSKKVMNEVTNLKVNDTAIKRINVEGITIDGVDAKDLDDGISAEKRLDGGYTLQISIADVGQIVKPGSEIDKEAFSRTTSIYLRTHVCPMIPKEIGTDICSLVDQTTKLTFTIQIDTDSEFNVSNVEVFKSRFKNRKRFDYEEFYKQFNNYGEEYNDELNLYNLIARNLLSKRLGRGAIKGFKDKIMIRLFNGEEKKIHTAQLVVQEFMILANIEVAKIFYKEKINGLFKLHNPKLKGQIIGPNANLNTAFLYNEPGHHLGLGQQFYTNWTSPIRRYIDLIMHRQLDAWLNKEKPVYNMEELRACYIYLNGKRDEIMNHSFKQIKDDEIKSKERKIKNTLKEKIFIDINSLSIIEFTELINFIKKSEIELTDKIKKEIIFRLDNNLLSQENKYNIIFFTKDKKIITNIISKIKYNHSYNDFIRFCNTFVPDTKIITNFIEENGVFYGKGDIKINGDHIEINYSIDGNKTSSDRIKKNARNSVTSYIRSKAKEFILEKILSKL